MGNAVAKKKIEEPKEEFTDSEKDRISAELDRIIRKHRKYVGGLCDEHFLTPMQVEKAATEQRYIAEEALRNEKLPLRDTIFYENVVGQLNKLESEISRLRFQLVSPEEKKNPVPEKVGQRMVPFEIDSLNA